MQPKLDLLDGDLVRRVLDEAFLLLRDHGVKVQSAEAVDLLAGAGSKVDEDIVHLPESVVANALATAPGGVHPHGRGGRCASVSGSSTGTPDEPGSKCTASPP